MEYRTVYSILDESARAPWVHVAIGLLAPPLAAARKWRRRSWGMLFMVALFAFVWNYGILPSAWAIYRDHEQAQTHLRSGDCSIVEGTIEQFHSMPPAGHSLESFTVNGVRFEYSDFDLSKPGFNNTASHGGRIHAGMRVRIHHREGSILQIEVPTGS